MRAPGADSRLPPPGLRADTLASAPARKFHDQRAEQPVATEHPRLTRPTGALTLGLVRLK